MLLDNGLAHVRAAQSTLLAERAQAQQMQQYQYTQPLEDREYPKPIYSYSCLIALALKNSPDCQLTVAEIYSFMWSVTADCDVIVLQ